MEIRIKKYTPEMKVEWDNFVNSSKNGTFLFYRDFMEYHSSRFADFSLLFYLKNKLIALLPANISGLTLYTHQGLTYGGFVLSNSININAVLHLFESLKVYLKDNGVSDMIYKTVPHIYHKLPAEEDLYCLFRNGANLIGRSISTCITQKNKIKYSDLRKRGIAKAQNKSLEVRENTSFEEFWRILETNLTEKFGVLPVHSLSEIEYLKSLFNNNIHLYEVVDCESVLAGCVIFETNTVAHVQYISASRRGKECGALDCLFDYLIQKKYNDKPFFEFGISTEKNGLILNEGLISQKEGFGGRGVVYDIYQLTIQ